MKKILYLLLLLPLYTAAQKIPDFGTDKVHIISEGKNIQAEIIPVASEPELFNDRYYFWYSSNVIHSTQGGYSGRLLNGAYKEYFPNKTLKEEGIFKDGLKTGLWKDWNENGNLIRQYTWKKGMKSGKFFECNDLGYIKVSGTYQNNILKAKDSTSFWQKLEFYKKKKSVDTAKP